jgi:CheY-like chemotaxis protein
MTIALVIDDNQSAADTTSRMLQLLGVEARTAYGPRAALILLKEFVPDIIFLDINMPGISGYEVMAYLRRDPVLTGVPVVYITSDDQPETAAKARQTGGLFLIIKPVTIEVLENTLIKAGFIRPS